MMYLIDSCWVVKTICDLRKFGTQIDITLIEKDLYPV